MTLDQLKEIMPNAHGRAETYFVPLLSAMIEFDIVTPLRKAAFLAQVAHESCELLYMIEIASGIAYEGRRDLGNMFPGDGVRFKGRGPIQITGRNNYGRCGVALGLPLIENPELLEVPLHGCRSAGWFWKTRGLNELADHEAFTMITRRINGGTNGMESRGRFYMAAKEALQC